MKDPFLKKNNWPLMVHMMSNENPLWGDCGCVFWRKIGMIEIVKKVWEWKKKGGGWRKERWPSDWWNESEVRSDRSASVSHAATNITIFPLSLKLVLRFIYFICFIFLKNYKNSNVFSLIFPLWSLYFFFTNNSNVLLIFCNISNSVSHNLTAWWCGNLKLMWHTNSFLPFSLAFFFLFI